MCSARIARPRETHMTFTVGSKILRVPASRESVAVLLALALALILFALTSAPPAHAAAGRGTATLVGTAPGETFGCSVSSAGDVNGVSYADVIVGAYHSGTAANPSGRAYIFFGGPR